MTHKLITQIIKPEQTWKLRQKVLRPNYTIEQVQFADDIAPGAFHVGVFLTDEENKITTQEPICIATFHSVAHPELAAKQSYRLRGMATNPDFRSYGAGKNAVNYAFDYLKKEKNCDLLWCNAREIAYGFYSKLGFDFFGETFEIDDIGPHKVMYKRL